jgi:hypothetical protein
MNVPRRSVVERRDWIFRDGSCRAKAGSREVVQARGGGCSACAPRRRLTPPPLPPEPRSCRLPAVAQPQGCHDQSLDPRAVGSTPQRRPRRRTSRRSLSFPRSPCPRPVLPAAATTRAAACFAVAVQTHDCFRTRLDDGSGTRSQSCRRPGYSAPSGPANRQTHQQEGRASREANVASRLARLWAPQADLSWTGRRPAFGRWEVVGTPEHVETPTGRTYGLAHSVRES